MTWLRVAPPFARRSIAARRSRPRVTLTLALRGAFIPLILLRVGRKVVRLFRSRALIPRRRRKARLARRELLGPDDRLLAILPLEHDGPVPDLESIPIDPESAVDRVVIHLEKGVAQPLAVQRAGALDGL